MCNLLKADLYRIVRSKLAIVSIILSASLPFIIVLLYYGVAKGTEMLMPEGSGAELVNGMFNARSLIISSFSLTDNFGLVIPIFSAIFVTKDLTNGTLRNKIISGHNRKKIYFSHLITSIIYNALIIIVYALFTSLFAFIFFDYGREINAQEIKSIIFIIILGIMGFVFVATISTCLSLILNSSILAIVLTVVISIVFSFICMIISLTDYEKFKYIIYFIPFFVNGSTLTINEATNVLFIEGMLSCLTFGVINTVLGIIIFSKKDLK